MPIFPSSVPTTLNLLEAVNNKDGILASNIDDAIDAITIDSTSGFPDSGYITIGNEAIYYTAKTSDTFTGCTRGADDTQAVTHSENDVVSAKNNAAYHNILAAEIIAIAQNISDRFNLGATSIIVPSGVAFILRATSDQIVLGTGQSVTISAPTPATANRTWTIPDISADGTFASLTGAQTFTGAKTFSAATGNPIHGTNTNDDPASGYVGEVILATGSNVSSAPTNEYGDLASISLTAGDWMVTGNCLLSTDTAVFTGTSQIGLSTASGNSVLGTTVGYSLLYITTPSGGVASVTSGSVGPVRFSLAGTTSVYFKVLTTYSSGSSKWYGTIFAIRVR
jgi:hypothetical protein